MSDVTVTMGIKNAAIKTGLAESEAYFADFSKSIGGMLGATFAGGAILEGIRDLAEKAKAIWAESMKTGATTEDIQILGNAAVRSSSDVDTLNTSLERLTKNGELAANEGNVKLQESFARLGVTLVDLKSKDSATIFYQIADAIKAGKDQGNQMADVLAIMGKGAAAMLPVLKQGSEGIKELGKQGLVMAESDIESLKTLNELSEDIGATWQKTELGIVQGVLALGGALELTYKALYHFNTFQFKAVGRDFKNFVDGIRAISGGGPQSPATATALAGKGLPGEDDDAGRAKLAKAEDTQEAKMKRAQEIQEDWLDKMERDRADKADKESEDDLKRSMENARARAEIEQTYQDTVDKIARDAQDKKDLLALRAHRENTDSLRRIGGSFAGVNYAGMANDSGSQQVTELRQVNRNLERLIAGGGVGLRPATAPINNSGKAAAWGGNTLTRGQNLSPSQIAQNISPGPRFF